MKNFKKYILAISALLMMVSCYDGIDSITEVDPGPDAGSPIVTIIKPSEGFEIQVPEPVTSTSIEFKVEDDIEIMSVKVSLDGQTIATFDSFLDYRIFNNQFMYDNITTGEHVLQVTATDIAGNETTATSNFSKEPPYTPLFSGETFYMNFDGSYTELISVTDATEVGNPGFAPEARVGSGAYQGATNSYLTFPTDGLLGTQFSASLWTKVNATPDRAALLVIGPPDTDNPDAQNNRTSGFRFFRENAGGMQRYKLNVGNGTADIWFDGGAAADVDPTTNDWVHLAFTISETEAVVYINGEVVKQGAFDGIDWTGSDILSIMSGAPRFSGWGHLSDSSYLDDLRLFNVALSQNEILEIIAQSDEIFELGFNGSYKESYSGEDCNEIGNPSFTGMVGAYEGSNAYLGAADSYLTFPTDGLLNDEFSAVFNYKVNAMPDRAGILVVGPPDTDNPDAQNNRTSGFRVFRENAGGMQRIKLNVGNGESETWFDGGAAADIDPSSNQWVQIAVTISETECVVYIDGDIVKQGEFSGIDWTGCDILSIMSGAPRFTGWGHLSDESAMDALKIYKKALSQAEIQAML
ncbi:LamG domain-containing protein [Winogradskyella bathintestinalis]|uniref:LamG domain-containing protein n=1 Tax=Winogradskyella bathintestinalis TaxID=3035208 RepID=A0ABT7ZQ27_9FLAO|nr:LamG domain-containing protein [Winogradskyella bathintestinalis]MDN3491127.1 LamG domain-containing protein [Winogradskyella bathintestinalis]